MERIKTMFGYVQDSVLKQLFRDINVHILWTGALNIPHATQATPAPPRLLLTTPSFAHGSLHETHFQRHISSCGTIFHFICLSYSSKPKDTGPKERVKQVYQFLLIILFVLLVTTAFSACLFFT